jgi:ABC-2 type transport system permease protein
MRKLLAMFRKEFLQIRRDPQSMKMLFILPILQTLLLGYAMTRDVRNVSIGILDLDQSPASSSLTRHIVANSRFIFRGHFQTLADLRESLLNGTVVTGIVIPNGFAQDVESAQPDALTLEAEDPARMTLFVDGQDAASAGTAAGYAAAIISQWAMAELNRELLSQGADAASLQILELRDRILYNPELNYEWYMVPGMLIILVTMTGALLTSFSLVRERENGTLEQLLVTPIHPLQVLLGKALPYWILSQLTFFIALGISGLWYGLPFDRADYLGLYLGVALYALTSVSLGILISTIVSSQQQALFLIWFWLIFFILTSGFLLPFESMPIWMQNVTEFNAVRHFLYMVRAFLLRGADPLTLLPEYEKLAIIALLFFGTSVALFRRKAS